MFLYRLQFCANCGPIRVAHLNHVNGLLREQLDQATSANQTLSADLHRLIHERDDLETNLAEWKKEAQASWIKAVGYSINVYKFCLCMLLYELESSSSSSFFLKFINIYLFIYLYFFNTIFVSSHMYPENPKGTQVIVGSMNMGYISDTARNRTHNRFHPKCAPIPHWPQWRTSISSTLS